MNRGAKFVPLGIPQSAAKLVGNPADFAVSRSAQILATNALRSETIISAGKFSQTSVIDNQDPALAKSWILRGSNVLAKSKTQSVLAANRGVYRVDVGYGSFLVCDPRQIVGVSGMINAQSVYPESRLDALNFSLRTTWRWISAGTSKIGNTLSRLFSRIPVPKRFQGIDLLSGLRSPTLATYWDKARGAYYQISSQFSRKLFYYTHRQKLRIEGPCSILIKA